MAVGKPRLVTYYADGTLRVYELSETGFVQLASQGPYVHAPGTHPDGVTFPARVSYIRDGQTVALQYSPSNTDHREINFDGELNVVATSINIAGGETGGAVGPTAMVDFDHVALMLPYIGQLRTLWTDPTNPATIGGRNPASTPDDDVRGIWVSPNGGGIVIGSAVPAKNQTGYRTGYSSFGGGTFPDYSVDVGSIDSPTGILVGCWITNDLFIGGSSNGLHLFQWDATGHDLNYVMTLDAQDGDPISIAATPLGGRWIAIGFLDGSDYSTYIYERVGPFPLLRQTVAGIGRTLGFTQAGDLLIDAAAKKAYGLDDDTWNERSGFLTNVVTGAIRQGVSPHIENPTGFTNLYDNRLADLQTGIIDLDDLWFTYLLDTSPIFDPTDASAAAVIGAYEATGGGWPVGGKIIPNVVSAADGVRKWHITADDVSHILFGTGIAFRYGLIYEKTTDKPLLHIDYQKTYSIPRNTQIDQKFNPAGMIIYTD